MSSYLQKYHLQKVEPVKNRTKQTPMDFYKAKQKVQKSNVVKIPIKNRQPVHRTYFHDDDPRSYPRSPLKAHKTQQLIRFNNEVDQFQRLKKEDQEDRYAFQQKISQRSHKSLNFKSGKDNSTGTKIITTIQDFFTRIMKSNDGCGCGDPCPYSLIFFQWADVPYQIVKDHYFRVLSKWQQSIKEGSKSPLSLSVNYELNKRSNKVEDKYEENRKNFIQIKKDIDRTQSESTTFQNNVFKQRQIKILMSYASQDLKVGYIQGMNMILSGLLYHIKQQIKTYAVFRKLIFLMRNIYLNNFKQCYQHIGQIRRYLKIHVNDLYNHFQQLMVDLNIVCLPWVLSLLTCIVPLDYLHLIYEGFLNQKWTFFYRVCLSLLIYHKERMMGSQDAGQILLLFSPTNESKHDYDWQDIILFSKSINL